jgi:tRNA 2-selenouridine synthase
MRGKNDEEQELLESCIALSSAPLLDVRSPGEFLAGHVPGAISFPLFTDAERALVGTCYKKEGAAAAYELGLSLVGPRLGQMVNRGRRLADGGPLTLMCWRGGMRSSSVAWLLQTAGVDARAFPGGYKAFRRAMRAQFERPWQLHVLGGQTGSGKTELLLEMRNRGHQVLDIEAAAHHRGSAFGQVNQPPAPSQEHFENRLGWALARMDASCPVWVEDESRMLGSCKVPDPLFEQMLDAPLWTIDRPEHERVARLIAIYASAGASALSGCTWKLYKKLGREKTHQVIQHIQQGELEPAVCLLLPYYAKGYSVSMSKRRGPVCHLDSIHEPFDRLADLLGAAVTPVLSE